MNKIRKRIIFLILIFVSFALMADGCVEWIVDTAKIDAPGATQVAVIATQIERGTMTARAATEQYDIYTERAAQSTADSVYMDKVMATLNAKTLTEVAAYRQTLTAARTPTPQPATITVKVGEVAKFEAFNVSVTKAEYVTGDPKGAIIITVVLENKTSTDLTYSINNFSVTNSAGKNKVLALPKPQGSTWSDDFLPNSSVPAGAKSTLQLLAQVLSGIEKDFVFIVSFGNSTANILLGR